MKSRDYIGLVHLMEGLKNTTRHSWTSDGHHESVAEHSWRLTVMAYFLKDEFPDIDIDKVMLMCLVHDLGELFTGDIPSFHKTDEDTKREEELLHTWVNTLAEPYRQELTSLYAEMNAQKTTEAKLYHALDGMEVVFQHNEADIGTWTELEFSLNRIYAADRTGFSSALTEIRRLLTEETDRKLAEAEINQ